MKAIVYAVALVFFGAAIYFTLEHNRKFTELEQVRLKTKADNRTVTANAEAKEAELRKLEEELADAQQKREVASTALEIASSEGAKLERDVSSLDDTIRSQEAELEQINTELAGMNQILEQLGEGITFDNLPDKVQQIKDDREAREDRLDELETLVDGAENSLAAKRDEIDRLTRRETQRNARISRNSMEAVVSAVNQDWGFLVIGAGSNSGFTPQTRMLVTRDGRLIGRVTPVAIEPTQTIAEIDFDSLPVGARIQPGDRVVLAKPTAN